MTAASLERRTMRAGAHRPATVSGPIDFRAESSFFRGVRPEGPAANADSRSEMCHDVSAECEERVLELQAQKRSLADATLSADERLLRTLTRADLGLLLS